MEILHTLVSDIRVFLYGGMVTLPFTLAGTMVMLGLFTANYAVLFFLLGYFLSPLLMLPINWILPPHDPFAEIQDRCRVNIHKEKGSNPTMPSTWLSGSTTWMGMVSFFLGYIMNNAYQLFSRDSTELSLVVDPKDGSDIQSKIIHRKSQAMSSFIFILLFTVLVFAFRFSTGCESIFGMLFTFLVSGAAGFGWYYVLQGVGEDRLSDLFGIANRLLAPGAIQNQPIACIPIAV